jgi:DNA-binding NarL/FixJ family response regulator
VVADDVMLVRQGIVEVTLMAAVESLDPDAAVVDIRMPPTRTDEGLLAAKRIRDAYPRTAVLVLSHYVEPGYAMRLVDEHPGAVGYLIKDHVIDGHALIDAVHRVCHGQTVIDPAVVGELLARQRRSDPLASLSAREHEVLALVAQGLSNRAIARHLHVTDRTVEAHIASTFGKLGLSESPDQHRRVLAVLAFLRR